MLQTALILAGALFVFRLGQYLLQSQDRRFNPTPPQLPPPTRLPRSVPHCGLAPGCYREPVAIDVSEVIKRRLRRSVHPDVPEVIKRPLRGSVDGKQAVLVLNAHIERIDRARQLFDEVGCTLMTVGARCGSVYYRGIFCGLLVPGMNDQILIRISDGWAYLYLRKCLERVDPSLDFLLDRKIEVEYEPEPVSRGSISINPR